MRKSGNYEVTQQELIIVSEKVVVMLGHRSLICVSVDKSGYASVTGSLHNAGEYIQSKAQFDEVSSPS